MDFKEKADLAHPREKTNILSKLFFAWLIPLFRKGSKKDLVIDDLYNCLKVDESEKIGNLLEKIWDDECSKAKIKGTRPRFYRVILRAFLKDWIILSLNFLLDECVIRIAQVIYLQLLIQSFTDGSSESDRYFYAGGLCASNFLHSIVIHPAVFETSHLGMQCRVGSCSLIYRKIIRLGKNAKEKTTVGQITNLLSNDVNRFDYNLVFIAYLFVGPMQFPIFVYFLWREFGVSCLPAIGFIVLLMPVQGWIGKLFLKYRSQIAKKTDERGRILNEIITAIRVIKMYAWEKPFSNLIHEARKLEVKILRKSSIVKAFYMSLFITSPKVIAYLNFLTYVLLGNRLTADKVFFAMSIYNVVRQVMVNFVPSGFSGGAEIWISMKRIEDFLLLEENESSENMKIEKLTKSAEDNQPSISFNQAVASWTDDKNKPNLDHVTFNVLGDRIVMVVGKVGSGKTSLLHTLIGELAISSGKCFINGTTSYASQEPWVFSGNVKQNILFGSPFEKEKYDKIVQVCSLEEDFKQLPYGDNTIVGERGVSLSGGQKARVNLARSLYQEADIYLMDDPLSAVDTKVSRHIFDKCIKKYLKGKLRILVTHQLQYLSQADYIILLNNGKIHAKGTYEELILQGIDFLSLVSSDEEESRRKRTVSESSTTGVVEVETIKKEKLGVENDKPQAQQEKMAEGSVSFRTYWDYWKSGGPSFEIIFLLVVFIVSQFFYAGGDYWLSYWTNQAEDEEHGIEMDYSESTFIWIYTGFFIGAFVLTTFRSLYFFLFCMRIGINVHNKMFSSLVRTPTKFFDNNPSGRIMNRFTKDIGSMDELLPPAFFDAFSIFLLMLGMLAIIIMSNVYVSIPAGIFIIFLYFTRRFYIKTARDIKRIESITRSPVFSHTSATFNGLTTIRALRAQSILINQFDGHQDIHSAAYYIFIASSRGFGLCLEMMNFVFSTLVILSFILIMSDAPGGAIGLSISSVMAISGTFQWGMRQSAETENYMTSVERALEYANLESEAPLESKKEKKVSKNWPKGGEIEFKKLYLAYDEKDVLKDLNFEIKAREKIGIVGRTGAGKSSIIAALFRLTEPRGEIFIDQVKVNDIGLHDLRKSISIIPQDPVLFSGTIRYNLDPFNQYKDEDLWRSLEDVDLKHAVPALDFKVSDAGSNFSVGQRQLVCLARAILRKNRIIVMDEATANVDPSTDSLIQQTIRSKFGDCTIITIAHRLHSVMDSDRILVLDNGYIVEYDHPHLLLQNESGALSTMVRHTGDSSSALLHKVAAEAYSKH